MGQAAARECQCDETNLTRGINSAPHEQGSLQGISLDSACSLAPIELLRLNKVLNSLIYPCAMAVITSLPNYLTIAEAANLLGVSVSTLRNWDRQNKLKPRRHPINGYRIYDRAVIVQLKKQIEGNT